MDDDQDTKPGRGRPKSYDPTYAVQAEKLCRLGATDAELADFFDVHVATLNRWKHDYPDFCASVKNGKDESDERVARSLYHRAVGYTFESEKVFQFQGEIVRTPTKEHVPPDTTACIFWLKNRRKDEWRDRQAVELTGADGGPIKTEQRTLDPEALAKLDPVELARIYREEVAETTPDRKLDS